MNYNEEKFTFLLQYYGSGGIIKKLLIVVDLLQSIIGRYRLLFNGSALQLSSKNGLSSQRPINNLLNKTKSKNNLQRVKISSKIGRLIAVFIKNISFIFEMINNV